MSVKNVGGQTNDVRLGSDPIDKPLSKALDTGSLSVASADHLVVSQGPGKASFDVVIRDGKVLVSQSGANKKPVLLNPKELKALQRQVENWKPSEDWQQQKTDIRNRTAWGEAVGALLGGKPAAASHAKVDLPRSWNFEGPASVNVRAEQSRTSPFRLDVEKLSGDTVRLTLNQPGGTVRNPRNPSVAASIGVSPALPAGVTPETLAKLEALTSPEHFFTAASATCEVDLSTREGRAAFEKIQNPEFSQQLIQLQGSGMSFDAAFSLLLQPSTRW
jgi:hypothetical protein